MNLKVEWNVGGHILQDATADELYSSLKLICCKINAGAPGDWEKVMF